jgi:hypothetical protein
MAKAMINDTFAAEEDFVVYLKTILVDFFMLENGKRHVPLNFDNENCSYGMILTLY